MDTRFGTQFIPSDTYYIPDSYAYPYDAFKVPVSHPIQRIRLAYNKTGPKYPPSPSGPYLPSKGTVLLLHGFPQTCYQYRHVWTPLAEAGYCVIAPDYRGAGYSEKPLPSEHAFTKKNMASDMLYLLEDKLGVIERDQQGRAGLTEKLHVVGHDIGGMIAYALAIHYPTLLTTLTYGECPLPGTATFHSNLHPSPGPSNPLGLSDQWHFTFHAVPNLPEILVEGDDRVRAYLSHFFNKLQYNHEGIKEADVGFYTFMYRHHGKMGCAFDVYRAFATDAMENQRKMLEMREMQDERDERSRLCGKLQWACGKIGTTLPVLSLNGEFSRHKEEAKGMMAEAHGKWAVDAGEVEFAVVEGAGHYVAEENPEGFVKALLPFWQKHE